jgi:hypothetical protein
MNASEFIKYYVSFHAKTLLCVLLKASKEGESPGLVLELRKQHIEVLIANPFR